MNISVKTVGRPHPHRRGPGCIHTPNVLVELLTTLKPSNSYSPFIFLRVRGAHGIFGDYIVLSASGSHKKALKPSRPWEHLFPIYV